MWLLYKFINITKIMLFCFVITFYMACYSTTVFLNNSKIWLWYDCNYEGRVILSLSTMILWYLLLISARHNCCEYFLLKSCISHCCDGSFIYNRLPGSANSTIYKCKWLFHRSSQWRVLVLLLLTSPWLSNQYQNTSGALKILSQNSSSL